VETKKMTVRVPKHLLEKVKEYARENDTTLTRLVTAYFNQITAQQDPLAEAPIVRRLSGSLSQDLSIEDHHNHLEEKYIRPS